MNGVDQNEELAQPPRERADCSWSSRRKCPLIVTVSVITWESSRRNDKHGRKEARTMRIPTRSICPFYGRSCMETYGSHTEFHSPCYHGLDAFTNFLPQRRRHVYLFVDHRHDIVCTHGPPR